MGWTFIRTASRDRFDVVRKEVEYETDDYVQKVIDHSVVKNTVYMVVERRPKPGIEWKPNPAYVNDPDGTFRWIAVFLTKVASDSYHNFGYKDLCETQGPYVATCPKRLIAAASPLRDENSYAAQWRRACLEAVAKNTELRARMKVWPEGATIKLNRPVRFADGYESDTFKASTIRRGGRTQRILIGQNGGLYRVSNLSEIGYTVVQ